MDPTAVDRSVVSLDSDPSNIDCNIALIDQLIDTPELVSELKTLASKLRQYNVLQFYTDGSLQRDSECIDTMGAGWVIANQEDLCFSASAILWPSSTKAEMLACLTALIVASPQTQVHLFTDSAATIDGFSQLDTFKQLSVRKREKTPNFQIWMAIAHIISRLDLKVQLIKVKAHSGDRLNDKADRLAKDAVVHRPKLNVNYLNLPGLAVVLTCDHLIIEKSSRKCIKQIFDAKAFYDTLQLGRHQDIKTLTELHHINWPATNFMLNYNASEQDKAATSFPQHRQRSFKYKLFSEELPTLTQLKIRRPDLYVDDKCLQCQYRPETQEHLWTCSQHQTTWRSILNRAAELCDCTLKQLNEHYTKNIELVLELIHESRTFITKGIVSEKLYEIVHQQARAVPKTHLIIAQVYNFIYRQIYTHIWIPRCDRVVNHERRQGITNRMKRSRIRPRQRPSPQAPSINTMMNTQIRPKPPWVPWFTASIRQGLTWQTHAYTTQADMFGSFTSSTLNSFTNNNNTRFTIDVRRRNRDSVVFSV